MGARDPLTGAFAWPSLTGQQSSLTEADGLTASDG